MKVEELPFDQYQRYRLVSDLLGTLRGKQGKLEVLDVGGRTAILRGFLPEDHVTLVDLEPSGEAGLVLGDGSKLPFRDKSFDVVAAFDTLEHVPPKLRRAFVRECARVSRGYVVLAGPYHSARVAEAEKLLQAFLKDKLGIEHRYLEEHRHNGLPSREATTKELAGLGAKVESFGHANLERWLAMMCLSMYLDHDPALRGLAARMHEFYNRALYASDHAEPVYRHVVVASLAGGPMPKSLLAPPRAPEGALGPFTELSGELVAFDRERTAWREERARLEQVGRDLRADLAGHAATLEELERDLAGEREELARWKALLEDERAQGAQAIGVLEADLAEHRRALAALEEEAETLRDAHAALERDFDERREEARAAIAALESDLAGHRSRIESLEAEARLQQGEFERERAEVRELIDTLNRDLGRKRELLAHVEGELAVREAHIAEVTRLAATERAEAASEIQAHQRLLAEVARDADGLREELARLQALAADERGQAASAIATLRAEIAAHVEGHAVLERELARERKASAEVARTLGEDLRQHRAVLEERGSELARVEAARAGEAQAARAERARLAAEIAAHEAVQRDLGDELGRQRAFAAELQAELERTRVEARAIQAELVGAIGAAQGLGRTLGEREAELERLRALLRSRAKNLQRALSFKKPSF